MSTRTYFAVAGAIVGAYFGNAALGYQIGSLVGGYVDPIKNFGPRLTDAQQQTSNDGVPIPILFGAARFSGNIIASGPLKEHKHEDDGKSGQTTTTYTYARTFAIGICRGPIGGIRRIWQDSKIVYDTTAGAPNSVRAQNQKFLNSCTIYLGGEIQTPDSELQAVFGIDNVPANRGLAYIVLRDQDLTNRAGSIPTFEFETFIEGSSSSFGTYTPVGFPEGIPFDGNQLAKQDPRLPSGYYRYKAYGVTNSVFRASIVEALNDASAFFGFPAEGQVISGWGVADSGVDPLKFGYINGTENSYGPGLWPWFPDPSPVGQMQTVNLAVLRTPVAQGNMQQWVYTGVGSGGSACPFYAGGFWGATMSFDFSSVGSNRSSGVVFFSDDNSKANQLGWCVPDGSMDNQQILGIYNDYVITCQAQLTCVYENDPTWVVLPDSPDYAVDLLGNIHRVGGCEVVSGSFLQLRLLTYDHTYSERWEVVETYPLGPVLETDDPLNTEAFWVSAYEAAVDQALMPEGLVYGADYPKTTDLACFCGFQEITDVGGVSLATIVSALSILPGLTANDIDVSQLTDLVPGFVVATDSTAADTINALAPAYQFDAAEWDGKIRYIKRGGNPVATLGLDQSIETDDTRITETRSQEVELPRILTIAYQDPAANYGIVTQRAERYKVTVQSTGTASISLPIVLETDKAAQIADIMLKDKWSALLGTLDETVADEWSILTVSDVIWVESEGALFRARLGDVTIQSGTFKYTATQDMQSAYTSNATGTAPPPPTNTTVGPVGPTLAYYLNLPALRDRDDIPGYYVAATGLLPDWRGAQLEQSLDGGLTYQPVRTITEASIVGQLLTELPGWNPDIIDEDVTFTVQISGGDLSSVTREQLLAGANGVAVGNELLQYQTATFLGDQTYQLSGLIRGRKNTEYGPHPVGTSFCLLTSLYFVQVDRVAIGRTLTLRITSAGTSTADGIVSTLVLNPARSVIEWAPTNARVFRNDTLDVNFSWSPRHRMGDSLTPYPSIYFTGYRLTVSDGLASKTYNTTDAAFAYTAAMQIADFGSAIEPLDYQIFAVNSITGAGDALGGTI